MNRKNHEVRFKCSKEEIDKIKKKADKLGMPVASFARYLSLNSKFRVSLEE